jgi:hypothetical protein
MNGACFLLRCNKRGCEKLHRRYFLVDKFWGATLQQRPDLTIKH